MAAMPSNLDYLCVLKALQALPFSVGKKVLVDFLWGNEGNEVVQRNKLSKLVLFQCLGGYTPVEIEELIDRVLQNNLVEQVPLSYNKFAKVFQLTSLGKAELANPSLNLKKISGRYCFTPAEITDKDREIFASCGFFLKDLTDEQKKAVIASAKYVLCVAGAGSGKTTTLSKRVGFLVKFRSVDPKKVLAITFTRKARQEMEKRLSAAEMNVRVETFNSFCEKVLQAYASVAYNRPVRVLSFRDRVRLVQQAIARLGLQTAAVIDQYYPFEQKRGKFGDELLFGFVNDCFSILDHCKTEKNELQDFSAKKGLSAQEQRTARMMYGVCVEVKKSMVDEGLRDYADQLLDALQLFQKHPDLMPKYDHVLVDEYQDINGVQQRLLDLLAPMNLFCVGDPRQSIFGWRGSKIGYILDFEKKYVGHEVVVLTKNYRSCSEIVQVANASIRTLRLPDLESTKEGKGQIFLVQCESEAQEQEWVIQMILQCHVPRSEVFVLARTNRQLEELSDVLKVRGIAHVVRREEHIVEAQEGEVLLSTIHAIKGMEAEVVFLLGCHGMYFPCKTGDHPIIDMVKEVEYDKEEEERRLFYVALTRAKRELYLSYTGTNHTRFITVEMKAVMQVKEGKNKSLHDVKQPVAVVRHDGDLLQALKSWRRSIAEQAHLPAFMIFHDKVLIEIAAKKPKTLQELKSVKGMGPAKMEKYGEAILAIIG